MNISETIRRPVGPLPAYAWGLLAVGGVVIFEVFKGRSGASADNPNGNVPNIPTAVEGPPGPAGAKGDTGAQGKRGLRGKPGPRGPVACPAGYHAEQKNGHWVCVRNKRENDHMPDRKKKPRETITPGAVPTYVGTHPGALNYPTVSQDAVAAMNPIGASNIAQPQNADQYYHPISTYPAPDNVAPGAWAEHTLVSKDRGNSPHDPRVQGRPIHPGSALVR